MRKCFSTHRTTQMTNIMKSKENLPKGLSYKAIVEGQAVLSLTSEGVFYNRVQEFNRDLSTAVLNIFVEDFKQQKLSTIKKQRCENGDSESLVEKDTKVEIKILEALSATGLRSIRYAKEINGVTKIIANDLSRHAVESIQLNVFHNNVSHIVETSHSDAVMLMYNNKSQSQRFTAIDLDPYGSPTIFLDAAVQSVDNGGLLLVTATDMAVLAGNVPHACYNKYGAISLKTKSCHEMALRILLQSIEAHANRYNRYIVPMLSVSVDFYIRVFVKVYTGAAQCMNTTSKLSMVYNCVGCGTTTLQPLGGLKPNPKSNKPNQMKMFLPSAPPVRERCDNCDSRHQMGGPIWSAPIHDLSFVSRVLKLVQSGPRRYATAKRIVGVLAMVCEELLDVPLYYTLDRLCGTMHSQMIPILTIRSAILNAGYRVSYSHTNKISIKTDAPMKVVWDIMRAWVKFNQPIKPEKIEANPVIKYILSQPITSEVNLTERGDANPNSRRDKQTRFQFNPSPNWGPGSRSTINTGQSMTKSKLNQNKKKRKYKGKKQKRQLSPPEEDEARKKRTPSVKELIIDTNKSESDSDLAKCEIEIGSVSATGTGAEADANNDTVPPDVGIDKETENTDTCNQPEAGASASEITSNMEK